MSFYPILLPRRRPPGEVVFQLKLRGQRSDVRLQAGDNEYFWFDGSTMEVLVNKTIEYDIDGDGLPPQMMEIKCTDKTALRPVCEGKGLPEFPNFT